MTMTEPGYEISPALVDLAQRWPTYPTDTVHMQLQLHNGWYEQTSTIAEILRCCLCHEAIYPDIPGSGTLAHLLLSHGYRMDGRQWNGRNELIGHA